jgi:hypothetical protein
VCRVWRVRGVSQRFAYRACDCSAWKVRRRRRTRACWKSGWRVHKGPCRGCRDHCEGTGSRLPRATAPRSPHQTKPSVDLFRSFVFMYMRHTAHIQFATLREQSSTVLLNSDLAPAAKGCFRFCTPGQRMLPKNLFMGEMHPQNASQLCSMRPTDGSKHGQGTLQVTCTTSCVSPFPFSAPSVLGHPKKRAAPFPSEPKCILGGAGECRVYEGHEREGPRKQSGGEAPGTGFKRGG